MNNPDLTKHIKATSVKDLAEETSLYSPKTDPQGMYTGVPADPFEKPVQDADDL